MTGRMSPPALRRESCNGHGRPGSLASASGGMLRAAGTGPASRGGYLSRAVALRRSCAKVLPACGCAKIPVHSASAEGSWSGPREDPEPNGGVLCSHVLAQARDKSSWLTGIWLSVRSHRRSWGSGRSRKVTGGRKRSLAVGRGHVGSRPSREALVRIRSSQGCAADWHDLGSSIVQLDRLLLLLVALCSASLEH